MCGLTGFLETANTGREGDRDVLRAMTASLAHRGPDDEGFYVDQAAGVYLGHRRLSVIDLTGGGQPMETEDGETVVVYNGEIYNHLDIRAALEKEGVRFVSDHSDTETLLHAYRRWGEGFVEKLNGMFAFAILDRREGKLVLARDRFGEKPLYWFASNGTFAFASELSALALHPKCTASTSTWTIQRFFAYGFLPAPHAFWEQCYKLQPGHLLTVGLRDGIARTRPYWRYEVEPDEAQRRVAHADIAAEVRRLLSNAVERRLMSDVPLGIFLSGGIDSSAVLALAAEHRDPSSIETFTMGFDRPSFDESAYANLMAGHIGTRHHHREIAFAHARDSVAQILGRLDEPLNDASIVPTSLLSAFARESVTVALSGDGGDELFCGYDPFKALGRAKAYAALVPRHVHRGLKRLVDLIPISDSNMSLDFKLRRTLTGLDHPAALWAPVWMSAATPKELAELFFEPVAAESLFEDAISVWNQAKSPHLVDRVQEYFVRFYLQNGVLTKTDRASMMHSLEVRSPFLDNELVDFSRRLPSSFKYNRGRQKLCLKAAMSRDLPPTILRRRKKGFGVPQVEWLRSMPTVIPAAGLPGVRKPVLERMWQDHRAGRADHRFALWASMVLDRHAARHDVNWSNGIGPVDLRARSAG